MALWLSSTGFGAAEEKEEVSSAKNAANTQTASFNAKSSEESVEDRMHLMLGKRTVLCFLFFVSIKSFFSFMSSSIP